VCDIAMHCPCSCLTIIWKFQCLILGLMEHFSKQLCLKTSCFYSLIETFFFHTSVLPNLFYVFFSIKSMFQWTKVSIFDARLMFSCCASSCNACSAWISSAKSSESWIITRRLHACCPFRGFRFSCVCF